MNGLSVVAAREQISLTIVMTTEHEKHIRVAADHLEELLAIAPANGVASVRLSCVQMRIVRTRAARRVEIVVGHDDGIVPWMAPQHTCRPLKRRVSGPVLQTNNKHRRERTVSTQLVPRVCDRMFALECASPVRLRGYG